MMPDVSVCVGICRVVSPGVAESFRTAVPAKLVDEGYDARDTGRPLPTGAQVLVARPRVSGGVMRLLVDCRDASIMSTRTEIGTRESRHVVAHWTLSE
jgi:hypothetical protein